ncbi:sugar transferase [Agreia sp. PsM10]|uniref:sugar transferase n=1 Tax=Agreia sp. PsM10 TaxID=3030533 RepID=UPI00263A60E6|nr:sugar transferase [Agreia sp. PsM10]MDN4641989.1 sugar transferase [Agreia sp. PsM10]
MTWSRKYSARLVVSDVIIVIAVIFLTQFFYVGPSTRYVELSGRLAVTPIEYTAVSVVLAGAWIAVLAIYGTRAPHHIGYGTTEYRSVIDASIRLLGIAALAAYLMKMDLSRGYFLLAFPVGIALLCLERLVWRRWLAARRKRREFSANVLIIGSEVSSSRIAQELAKQTQAGLNVVGVCIPTGIAGSHIAGTDIPILGNLEQLGSALEASGADTVLISSSDEVPPERVREISWMLDSGRQHLLVAPSLTDVAGPRIHMRPVAGLPLVHVEMPKFEGRQRFAKRLFDIVGSGVMLAVFSPLFLVVSFLVRQSGPGDVFYRQERVGINGQPFGMIKFRSMVDGADASLLDLLEQQGSDGTPLHKVRNDPRVTPVGKILRKYSIDEFPQLVNVFMGSMSLVGPRPQRDGEVALYDDAARRRLIVKPGMSGLWQVSGRSSLSWDDAIRLDLYYIENWSLTRDISILLRTVKAVVAPGDSAH